MRVVYEYSHLGGAEILKVHYPQIDHEINSVIRAVGTPGKTKQSKEKTMAGRMLYSPKELNSAFIREFRARGYAELRDTYDIRLPRHPDVIHGAYKHVDFVKDGVLIEVQFGKYAFMFYDLVKFQYFFNENKANVGVEIVPAHALHKHMSTGVSYGEQLIFDIERLKRHFPAVPVKVMLLDV